MSGMTKNTKINCAASSSSNLITVLFQALCSESIEEVGPANLNQQLYDFHHANQSNPKECLYSPNLVINVAIAVKVMSGFKKLLKTRDCLIYGINGW